MSNSGIAAGSSCVWSVVVSVFYTFWGLRRIYWTFWWVTPQYLTQKTLPKEQNALLSNFISPELYFCFAWLNWFYPRNSEKKKLGVKLSLSSQTLTSSSLTHLPKWAITFACFTATDSILQRTSKISRKQERVRHKSSSHLLLGWQQIFSKEKRLNFTDVLFCLCPQGQGCGQKSSKEGEREGKAVGGFLRRHIKHFVALSVPSFYDLFSCAKRSKIRPFCREAFGRTPS